MDQTAKQGFVFDDLDVLLNVLDAGKPVGKRRYIRDPADRLDLFVLSQLFGERDKIYRASGVGELSHPQINAAMGIERKVFSLQRGLRRLMVGEIVQKDRAQDGAFGVNAGRQPAIQTVVGCGHTSEFPFLHFRAKSVFMGEKHTKTTFQAKDAAGARQWRFYFQKKFNPVCTSHTDRVLSGCSGAMCCRTASQGLRGLLLRFIRSLSTLVRLAEEDWVRGSRPRNNHAD